MINKEKKLIQINNELISLLYTEKNMIANLANASALLYNSLDNINWSGFYLVDDKELILGPFQGKPACVRISIGKGVCGSAAQDRKTYLVDDVHEFPGHIACDSVSQSEIVVPIISQDKLVGVLDIDSPLKMRFDEMDQRYLEQFVNIIVEKTNFR